MKQDVCAATKYAVVVLRFEIRFPCSAGTVGGHLASTLKDEIEVMGKTESYMYLTFRPYMVYAHHRLQVNITNEDKLNQANEL